MFLPALVSCLSQSTPSGAWACRGGHKPQSVVPKRGLRNAVSIWACAPAPEREAFPHEVNAVGCLLPIVLPPRSPWILELSALC